MWNDMGINYICATSFHHLTYQSDKKKITVVEQSDLTKRDCHGAVFAGFLLDLPMKMEAVCSSKMLADFYQTYIPEDSAFHNLCLPPSSC
jgi:hypothetical protein